MFRMATAATTTDTGLALSAVYGYTTDGLLSTIQTPSTTYTFSYGVFDLRSSVMVGTKTLAQYHYDAEANYRLKKLDYGNTDNVQYEYDNLGRIVKESYWKDGATECDDFVAYSYDNDGNLATVYDSATQVTTTYYYDLLGRALYYTKADATGQIQSVQYAYDVKNNLTGLTETVGNSTQGYTYQYDDDNRVVSATVGNVTVTYDYDDFGRLTQKVTKQGDTTVKTEAYTFVNWTDSNNVARTTSQIATCAVTVGSTITTYSYTYDLNGNILTISDGTNVTSYVYDSANQLVRENNQGGNYTHTWTYDDAGNIKFRKEYAYTTVESLANVTPNKTVAYDYNDETWGDLLTSYDSNAITYDGIGNPLTWGNRTFTWQRGRQLASLAENGITWSYTYDANGMRTSRTGDGKTYTYTYNGSQLVQMTVGSNTLRFTYDAAGTPLTVNYNGTTYYYTTNLQGDVTGIVTETGATVVTYSYDSWGKLLEIDGTLKLTLGEFNPLRYRGYVYDAETALYYLQSRYYDPGVGRFINLDKFASTGQGLMGLNMFAYCGNSSPNNTDASGNAYYSSLNAELDVVKPPEYINGQKLEPYNSIPFGDATVGHGGCGPIAAYNAMQYLGMTGITFESVLQYFLSNDGLACRGWLGTNNDTVISYFRDWGYTVVVAKNARDAMRMPIQPDVAIVRYGYGYGTSKSTGYGEHYVAFERLNGKGDYYNVYNNYSKPISFNSICEFLETQRGSEISVLLIFK